MISSNYSNRPTIFKAAFIVIALFYFFLQFSFLTADADLNMGYGSRGAWTDEGLNTSQIRNYVNHGVFDILECDNFLKTPLFSAYLYIPFTLFGTSLMVARLSVLFLVFALFAVLFWNKTFRLLPILLVLTTLLFSPIFQHAHFSIAETSSIIMIALAGLMLTQINDSHSFKNLYFTYIFLLSAVLFKVQFIYILILPPVFILLNSIIFKEKIRSKLLTHSIFILFGLFLSLFFLWFLPFKNEFELIMNQQSGDFSLNTISLAFLKENLINYFFAKRNIIFTFAYVFSLIISIKIIFTNTTSSRTRNLILFSIIWFVLELHKLPMAYLPIRYMISIYFSMGLLISIIVATVLTNIYSPALKLISLGFLISLIGLNGITYYYEWNNRSFVIHKTNLLLSSYNLKDKTVIGAWAPALTWESKSMSLPIWKDFLRTTKPIQTYKPTIVISENNEEDSNQAYSALDINLNAISDSVSSVNIANWEINIYWIQEDAWDRNN